MALDPSVKPVVTQLVVRCSAFHAREGMVEGEENSWAHPVVIGRRLYLRYADNLYCFNVRA